MASYVTGDEAEAYYDELVRRGRVARFEPYEFYTGDAAVMQEAKAALFSNAWFEHKDPARAVYVRGWVISVVVQVDGEYTGEYKIVMRPVSVEPVEPRAEHWYLDALGMRHEFHPNCRCTPVGITSKEQKMKIRNKFYVASPSVTHAFEQGQDNTPDKVRLEMSPKGPQNGKWTRKDLASAVEHGQTMLATDPLLDHVAIVKIVKLVRRPKPKFIVEDVK